MSIEISEYKNTDGLRRWEIEHEGVQLVLLEDTAPEPYNSELLGFKGSKLIWRMSPQTKSDYDYIVNVWSKDNVFYAGSFSGFEHIFNYKTGEILETKFTK